MKTMFITGAAHGLGLATAKRFAGQGWFIGIYDINREGLATALNSSDFPNACGQYCDVTERDSVEAALAHFSDHTNGRLDVLVNNAGVLSSGKFEEIDPAAHEQMIAVNVLGVTNVAQAGFELLMKTPGSTLVNLCSVSSLHGLPRLAVYSASKFYVDGLTEALHVEWAPHDIRVTSVKPPLVNTPMAHAVDPMITEKLSLNMEPEYVAAAIEKAILGKRIDYVLGTSARLWAYADKFLPESGRRWLVRYLTNH